MKNDLHVDVMGEQPALANWLLPLVDSAVGEGADRWTYEVFELGSPDQPELRVELRSPTRDAAITVTAAAPHPEGRFTTVDPIKVSVRRSSGGDGPGVFGRRSNDGADLQRDLARDIELRSAVTTPGSSSPAGAAGGAYPGPPRQSGPPENPGARGRPRQVAAAGRPSKSRRRFMKPLLSVVVLALVIAFAVSAVSGLLDGVLPSLGTPGASPTAASPTKKATARPVIKGTKPKSATACKPTGASKLTPKRSAKGNKATTCAVAEQVRAAYVKSSKAGRTVSLTKLRDPKTKTVYTVKCTGKSTITCSNKAKKVYLY